MHNVDSDTKARLNDPRKILHPSNNRKFLTYSWLLPEDMLFLLGKDCHPGSSHTFLHVQLNFRKATFDNC